MIDIQSHAEGATLAVKAAPGSRSNEVRGSHQGALKISVTQAAEKGKANKAVTEVLAKALGLRGSQVEVIAGHTSPRKRLLVRNLTPDELRARIEPLLEE